MEQAEALSSILEYPPENLGGHFQSVFSGIDPDGTRKAQCFPINKALLLWHHEFLQRHRVPDGAARFNAKAVEARAGGVTPPVLQNNFVGAPNNQEDDEFTEEPSSTKYRGPVDSTTAVRGMEEHDEGVSWSFLCPDATDQELDRTSAWQTPTETGHGARAGFGDRKRRAARTRAFPRQIRQKALVEHMRRFSRCNSQNGQRLIPAESGSGVANRSRGRKDNHHRRNTAAWRRLGSEDNHQRRNATAWRRLGTI